MIFEIKKDAAFSNPFRKSTRIGKRANFLSLKVLFQIVIALRDSAGVNIAVRREESLMRERPDFKGEVLSQSDK